MYVTEREVDGQVVALERGVLPTIVLPVVPPTELPFRALLDVAAELTHVFALSQASKANVLAFRHEGHVLLAVQHNGMNPPFSPTPRLVPNTFTSGSGGPGALPCGVLFTLGDVPEVDVNELHASLFYTFDACDPPDVTVTVGSEKTPDTVLCVSSSKVPYTGVLVSRMGAVSIKTRSGMYSGALTSYGVLPVVSSDGLMLRYQNVPAHLPAWMPPLLIEVDMFGIDLFSSRLMPETQQCIDCMVARLNQVTFGDYATSCRDTHGTLVSYKDAPSLFTPLRTVLRSLASCDDVRAWITALDTNSDMNPLVRAVATRRATDVGKKMLLQTDLKERLESETLCAREMDGVAFDILLLDNATLDNVPSGWKPDTIVATEDEGFLNMIYIHQWRATLERFIELAREAAFPHTEALLHALSHFRTGILWSPREEAGVTCTHRQTSEGEHIFLFNPAPGCMVLKLQPTSQTEWQVAGCLQTQCAKQRDVVVALFVRYAVRLLADLIHITSGADATHVASTLFGMYMGSLQAVDLRHHYKQTQRTVRELRQAMPVTSKKRKQVKSVSSPHSVKIKQEVQ